MATDDHGEGPASAEEPPSATEASSKGKSWEFTPARRAAFERAAAVRAQRIATRKAQKAGVNTLGDDVEPKPGNRPGAPTTSRTPHAAPKRQRPASDPASDVAPERSAPTSDRSTSDDAERPASDNAPAPRSTPAKRSFIEAVGIGLGIRDPKGTS